jgi:glycerol-3-phosphate acyltransferase PlsY
MSLGSLSNAWPGLLLGISFFIGSIPFGIGIARVFKFKDFWRVAPHSGARPHLAETLGFWPAGILSLFLDFSKGVLALLLVTPIGYRFLSLFLRDSSDLGGLAENLVLTWAAGFFVVLGHCFSPWLQFRGGKGVATAFGVILVLSPFSALFGAIGFGLAFFYFQIISLASIAGLVCASVSYLVMNSVGIQLWMGAAMIFLVLLRHESNIDALLEQREPTFVPKL